MLHFEFQMPEESRLALISVISKLPQQVVWRWETDMKDKPHNLFLHKWLPQPDILGHPNTKLFITHGGQSSLQEAWCHKVPMVVLSVFGDQPMNADEVERLGTGIHIPFKQMTEPTLLKAVNEVLQKKAYQETSNKLGSLLTDQIEPPLERAVWWLEFLLRHPDYKLAAPIHRMSWVQLNQIDVAAVIILGLTTFMVTSFCTIKYCMRICFERKSKMD